MSSRHAAILVLPRSGEIPTLDGHKLNKFRRENNVIFSLFSQQLCNYWPPKLQIRQFGEKGYSGMLDGLQWDPLQRRRANYRLVHACSTR